MLLGIGTEIDQERFFPLQRSVLGAQALRSTPIMILRAPNDRL